MTKQEFLEEYNGAPYDLEEVAGLLSEITDDVDLVNVADAFLDIQDSLRRSLDDIGFEFG